jgi:outer membrane protein assembly factor BamB
MRPRTWKTRLALVLCAGSSSIAGCSGTPTDAEPAAAQDEAHWTERGKRRFEARRAARSRMQSLPKRPDHDPRKDAGSDCPRPGDVLTTRALALDTRYDVEVSADGRVLASIPGTTVELDADLRVLQTLDFGGELAVDGSGNVYMLETSDIEPVPRLVKYDQSWMPIWIGATGDHIAANAAGTVVLQIANSLVAFDADGKSMYSLTLPANDFALDPQGNLIVVGPVAGKLEIGGVLHTSEGPFIAKFDAEGAFVWVRVFDPEPFGTMPGRAALARVTTAVDGSVIAGGDFFGTLNLGGDDLVFGGSMEGPRTFGYLAKLDAAGTHLWSKSASIITFFASIVSDAGGNIVYTGQQDVLPPFLDIEKLDPNGTTLWSINAAGVGSGLGFGYDVAVAGSGTVYWSILAGGPAEPGVGTIVKLAP